MNGYARTVVVWLATRAAVLGLQWAASARHVHSMKCCVLRAHTISMKMPHVTLGLPLCMGTKRAKSEGVARSTHVCRDYVCYEVCEIKGSFTLYHQGHHPCFAALPGVLHWELDADKFENDPDLEKIRQERGYSYQVQHYGVQGLETSCV